jgi:hypothetical protein
MGGGRPSPRASARQVAQRRRQRNIYMAMGGSGAVVVIIVAIVAVNLLGSSTTKKLPAGDTGAFAIPASAVAEVTGVPVSALVDQAMKEPSATTPPVKLPPKNPVLTAFGKPEFLYMGGEYCPYCAAERWSLVMALSKFGTFTGLKGTQSSATDTLPSTPTFSFYGSTFKSAYLNFQSVELFKNSDQNASTGAYPTLQTPTAQQEALITEYDAPPYTTSQEEGGIPFLYIGGRYLQIGPQYVASNLSGVPFTTAAALQSSGTNATSQEAEASAGYLVGDICALTHLKPASVCSKVPAALIGITTSSKKISHVSVPAKTKTPTTTAKSKKS